MISLLEDLGVVVVEETKNRLAFTAKQIKHTQPQKELCRQMRASFALAGPLLARVGSCTLPVPGGDRIGRRPLDAHISALQQLGAVIEVFPDRYEMTAPHGLKGADIFLEEMSVLATENVVMAAALASGPTCRTSAVSSSRWADASTASAPTP